MGRKKRALKSIYFKNPLLKRLSYIEQWEFLNARGFVHLNGFTQCMNSLGNDAYEIICDVEPLQKQWAIEQEKYVEEDFWSWQILLHQINKINN